MSERRTVQELIGVSVNSSSLRMEARSQGGETSLQRVAALGMAVLHVQHGADRAGPQGRGGPLAEVMAAPAHRAKALDQLAGELGSCLWHVRYGGQHGMVGEAVVLFAAYIGQRARFADAGPLSIFEAQPSIAVLEKGGREGLLLRFSERAIHEWLSDRCIACGGSGKLERMLSGSWVRPRGQMQRNATFRVCTSCHGSRRAMPSHTARRVAIGITLEQYEQGGWAQHFKAAQTWLEVHIARRLNRPLTVQLERSRKRD